MLTDQPSTYDMFGLIELYGRKLQSVKYLYERQISNMRIICKSRFNVEFDLNPHLTKFKNTKITAIC